MDITPGSIVASRGMRGSNDGNEAAKPPHRLWEIGELVEMVVLKLDNGDISRCMRVDRTVRDMIQGSPSIQRTIWQQPSQMAPFYWIIDQSEKSIQQVPATAHAEQTHNAKWNYDRECERETNRIIFAPRVVNPLLLSTSADEADCNEHARRYVQHLLLSGEGACPKIYNTLLSLALSTADGWDSHQPVARPHDPRAWHDSASSRGSMYLFAPASSSTTIHIRSEREVRGSDIRLESSAPVLWRHIVHGAHCRPVGQDSGQAQTYETDGNATRDIRPRYYERNYSDDLDDIDLDSMGPDDMDRLEALLTYQGDPASSQGIGEQTVPGAGEYPIDASEWRLIPTRGQEGSTDHPASEHSRKETIPTSRSTPLDITLPYEVILPQQIFDEAYELLRKGRVVQFDDRLSIANEQREVDGSTDQ